MSKRRLPKWLQSFVDVWNIIFSDNWSKPTNGGAAEPVDGQQSPDPATPQDVPPPTPPPSDTTAWRNPRITESVGEATDWKPYDLPGHPPDAPANQRRQLSIKWPSCSWDWLREGHAAWTTSVDWLLANSDTLIVGRNRVATLSAYQVDTGDGVALRPCFTVCADQIALADIRAGDLVVLRARRGAAMVPVYMFRAPNSPTGAASRVKWQAVAMNQQFAAIDLTAHEREVLRMEEQR